MLTAEYAIEFIKINIVAKYITRLDSNRSIKRHNFIMIILLLFLIDISKMIYYRKIIVHSYDTYFCGFLAIITIYLGLKDLKNLFLLIELYVMVCFTDMLIAGLLTFLFSVDISLVLLNPVYKLILNSVPIFFLLVISYFMRLLNVDFRLELLSNKEICLFIIGLIGCGFCIAPYQIYVNKTSNSLIGKLLTLGISATGFLIISLFVMLIIKTNNLKYLKELHKLQDQVLVTQQLYFRNCFEQEREMKKFQHDINEHLYCISHLIEDVKYNDAKIYIDNITREMRKIKEKTGIETGSYLINIVLADLMNKYVNKNISLSWRGRIPDNNIEYKDLCSLFWNLLKNAYEATEQCDNGRIEVITERYDNAFYIKISNTCKIPVKILSGNILVTSKSNPSKHGYGSQIISDISKKYNCQIKYSYKNQVFCVEMTFLNICK